MSQPPHTSTICAGCNVVFNKSTKEKNRRLREGATKFYCNIKCANAHLNKKPHPSKAAAARRNLETMRIKGKAIVRTFDDFSPFRYYIRKAKSRTKDEETDLTVQYLKQLWDQQEGRCAYGNIPLLLNQRYLDEKATKVNDPRFTASLDRIDSSRGYVVGNVHFVSTTLNLAKGTMSDEKFREFISILRAADPATTPETSPHIPDSTEEVYAQR